MSKLTSSILLSSLHLISYEDKIHLSKVLLEDIYNNKNENKFCDRYIDQLMLTKCHSCPNLCSYDISSYPCDRMCSSCHQDNIYYQKELCSICKTYRTCKLCNFTCYYCSKK